MLLLIMVIVEVSYVITNIMNMSTFYQLYLEYIFTVDNCLNEQMNE